MFTSLFTDNLSLHLSLRTSLSTVAILQGEHGDMHIAAYDRYVTANDTVRIGNHKRNEKGAILREAAESSR